MPTVEKVSGGQVYVRGIGRFRIGDQADVSEDDAAYLCDERGDFTRIDYTDDHDSDEDADSDDASDSEGDGSQSDGEYTCAGKDGECTRTVDEPGGRCWQHAED